MAELNLWKMESMAVVEIEVGIGVKAVIIIFIQLGLILEASCLSLFVS